MTEEKAIPFVIFENGQFIIPKEARDLLSNEAHKNVGIISLVGKYRTGKSFLLNRVLLNRVQSPGFGVGPTIKPCTKGIWIWSHPLMISNSHCKDPFPCFLIDTEGLGAYDEEVNHDSKIFLIAILISSLFIFNSFGTIDENAISSLSFVLNLSKTIKLRNNSSIENEEELAQYFPTLFWLLRDFSLKLEDHEGNVITEKQYLENALKNMKGSSEIIEEKNKVRSLIRTYFPERDCFVMVRPVEKESDLQNMQRLPDEQLRKEFVQQAKIFRNKVTKKTKPKIFMKKTLTGAMLVELVQSVLDAINGGNIPVIENSWKYVIENECIKHSNNAIKNFIDDIEKYKNENCTKKNYAKEIKTFMKTQSDKYIDTFSKNGLFDEESKEKYIKKLKGKIDEEIKKIDKENEKIFEQRFNEEIDIKAKEFMKSFDESEKYSKNYYQFFNDLETFRNESEDITPEFPAKKEVMFDKILIIIRKFIDTYFVKAKLQTEKQIAVYKNAIDKLQGRLKELNEELIINNKNSSESINKLNSVIGNEKIKQKEYENTIARLQNEKKRNEELNSIEVTKMKSDFDSKYKAYLNEKTKIENELKAKEEELLVIKMNSEKVQSLNEQKLKYLDKEVNNWKERYNKLENDSKIKEQGLNNEISNLKNQNLTLKNEQKIKEESTNNLVNQNMNSILAFIKENMQMQNQETKTFYEKIISSQQEKEISVSKDKELLSNYKETTQKNQELTLSLAASESKIKQYEEQINKLNLYKEIIHNSNSFKCKFCLKNFNFDSFKTHYPQCQRNMLTSSQKIDNISIDKLKIKILKGRVKQDELGKPFLEYIIDIWYNGQNWRINKRFNQFANLYKTLKSIFRGIVNMPPSADIFVSVNGVGQISSFHENKILQLEKFIKDLAEIDVVNKSKPFRKFLEFENFVDEEDNEIIENSRYNINNITNSSINLVSKEKEKIYNNEEEDNINQI